MMTASTPRPPRWRLLLDLGKELVAQPDIERQRELILEAARNVVGGEAKLWLMRPAYGPPEPRPSTDGASKERISTHSLLMQRAAASELPVFEDGAVAIPLRGRSETLGVLEVRRARPRLTEDDVALLEGLATQAAAALQAGRQVAVERWRLEQLSLVRTVSAEVANVLDLDELSQRVASLVLETFGYYYVALFTLEPDQETLLCRASAGPLQPENGRLPSETFAPSVELGQGIVGHVAKTGEEILAGDVSRDSHYRYVDVLPETKSEAALPLRIKERTLGVLDVQSDQPERFDETDVLVLRALADQIAIAVEDARLYGDLRLHADQLSAVAEVSRVVASILDLDELLDRVAALIHEQFGYPYVHLFTVDKAQQKVVYRAGWPPRAADVVDGGQPVCDLDDSEGVAAWVACHGETVLSNDLKRDHRYRRLAPPPIDTHSQLAVPLTFGDEVLGVLDVQSRQRGSFNEDDQFLFKALADSVAIAIRNAHLYQSERWRRQVADSMRDVAGLLSAGIALNEVLNAVLDRLGAILPCDGAAIWLLRDHTLCLSAVRGADENVCIDNSRAGGNAWLRRALVAGEPLVRTSSDPAEPLGTTLGLAADYSAIAAPLRAGDQRLGLLTLVHQRPNRYGPESRAMTAAFASYAAVAIENTRLYQRAQEQAYISTVLLEVAEATQSLTRLEDVLDTVVRLMPMLVGVERCAVFLWEEDCDAFVARESCGLSDKGGSLVGGVRMRPSEMPAFEELRRTREPVSLERAPPGLEGFDSPLLMPLVAHGEVQGAMLVDYRQDSGVYETHQLHEERMAIMRGIAYQAAMAAENARLLEARQEEAYVSAALLQVAQAVVSLNDLDEILTAIVRITPMLVGVERCAIFLWDSEEDAFSPGRAYGTPMPTASVASKSFTLLDAVRQQGKRVVLDDVSHFEGLIPAHLIDEEQKSSTGRTPTAAPGTVLGVPLTVKGDVLGVLLVGEGAERRRFDERRLEIITGIAQQAALAVQNDHLQQEMAERERLEQELELAREIQRTFMPEHLPSIPGWELAVTWRAARQVAGDFYDVFGLPGNRLGVVIADVADKGMPAALFMALTRTLMRAAAGEGRSPGDALRRVNELLVPDAQHGMFVTGLYAILSVESGKVVVANAGHHPPLILRSDDGKLEQMERGEIALGVLEDVVFREHAVTLRPGDCMVLFTDGVTEALSTDDVLFGESRLHEVIRQRCSPDTADGTLSRIVDAVADFVGDHAPSDDLTLMVVRRQDE